MIGQHVLSTYDEADCNSLLANSVNVLDGTDSVYGMGGRYTRRPKLGKFKGPFTYRGVTLWNELH